MRLAKAFSWPTCARDPASIACSLAYEQPRCAGHRHGCRAGGGGARQRKHRGLGLADRVAVLQCSLGSGIGEKRMGTFDAVVSNPPYVPTAVMAGIPREVADFEPTLALDGGADGLDLFRPLAQGRPGPEAWRRARLRAVRGAHGRRPCRGRASGIRRRAYRGRSDGKTPRTGGETPGRIFSMALENLRGTLDEAQAVMEERLGAFRPKSVSFWGRGSVLWPSASPIPIFIPGEVPGMGVSTANGHVGRFVAGVCWAASACSPCRGGSTATRAIPLKRSPSPCGSWPGSGLVRSSPPTLPAPSTRPTASATSAS